MFVNITCSGCPRRDCPSDCLIKVFQRSEQRGPTLAAYISDQAVQMVFDDTLYRKHIGSIEVTHHTLSVRGGVYRLVRFGTEHRPRTRREDVSNYIKRFITEDSWMALSMK